MSDFLALNSRNTATSVDLLVILGGGWEYREITGAELFKRGLAKRILMTGAPEQRDARNFPINMPQFNYLVDAGIPPDKIDLDSAAKNTWEEVAVIRNYLNNSHWASVLIVTDPPHMRRLDWVCRRVLSQSGMRYHLVPTSPDWWDARAWWRNAESMRFMALEYIKLIYYGVRYSYFYSMR